jgi:methionyl-tRNA formyltransferase
MKLVIFAHQNWGVEAIKKLNGSKHEILHVFTHPLNMDPKEKVWYPSVKDECKKLNLSVEEKLSISDQDLEKIKKINPDLILSVGWRRLLPSIVFTIPKFGTVNLHDSLIPNYRGFAPINWAIINGETHAGITTHFIDEGIDTGNIILQIPVTIDIDETAFDVYKKLLKLSPQLILDTLDMIETGHVKPNKEKNPNRGFFCSRRFPDDGKINWKMHRLTIYNLIRALSDPYPNAFCYFKDTKILIKKAKLTNDDFRGTPGRISSINNEGVIVTCGIDHKQNQGLLITEIQVQDSKLHPKELFTKLWENLE